jgi:hypothetical protein
MANTAVTKPSTLYRFRIVGDAGNGVLKAVDAADQSSVFLVCIFPDRVVKAEGAFDLARQIGERSGREVFSDQQRIYFVAGHADQCRDIVEMCVAGGLVREELVDAGAGSSQETAIPAVKPWSTKGKVLAGLCVLLVMYVVISHLGSSSGQSEAVHNGTGGGQALSSGEAPQPSEFVSGAVGSFEYGTNAVVVGSHTVSLYGIGPISAASSGDLLAYLAKNSLSLHCSVKSGAQYICTYMDEISGERDFSRIIVRFGAARAAVGAPSYLRHDEKYAKLHRMGIWRR